MNFLKDRGYQHPYSSEITPRAVYAERRGMLKLMAAGAAGATLAAWAGRDAHAQTAPAPGKLAKLPASKSAVSGAVTMETLTPYKDVTSYNNYYEFGTDKGEPAENARTLKTSPWKVAIEGEVKSPKTYDLAELMALAPIEERIYRMRCVEGWSMVIPWEGYSLAELIKKLQPTGNAKYVEFTTLADKAQMPKLGDGVLDWPYVESLRMDEAMNPLTLLTFGLYGEVLPNQNGAPVRIVVPWKYGFKSAKSLVKIRFTDKPTQTSWMKSGPSEYGYFSNVNPTVDHPRWSQATERRIGEGGIFAKKRPTLMFNGYDQQVASLYTGMDLKKNF